MATWNQDYERTFVKCDLCEDGVDRLWDENAKCYYHPHPSGARAECETDEAVAA